MFDDWDAAWQSGPPRMDRTWANEARVDQGRVNRTHADQPRADQPRADQARRIRRITHGQIEHGWIDREVRSRGRYSGSDPGSA